MLPVFNLSIYKGSDLQISDFTFMAKEMILRVMPRGSSPGKSVRISKTRVSRTIKCRDIGSTFKLL